MKQLTFDTQGKICKKCDNWKPLSEFHIHPEGQFGRRPKCKKCRNKPKTPYELACIKLEKWGLRRCQECNRIRPLKEFQVHGREKHRYYVCRDCMYPNRHIKLTREKFAKLGKKRCNECGIIKPLSEFRYRADRDCYEYTCRNCTAKRKRRYAIENRDKVRIHKARWYKKRLKEDPNYFHKHYMKNREASQKRRRQYYEKHKDGLRAYARQYYAEHRQEIIAYQKKYNAENPDKVRARRIRRRSRESGSGGSYTAKEWQALCDKYGNRCLCCESSDEPLTVDHIVPISKGGSSDIDNLQPLCKSCNCSKQDKIIDYCPDQRQTAQLSHDVPPFKVK